MPLQVAILFDANMRAVKCGCSPSFLDLEWRAARHDLVNPQV